MNSPKKLRAHIHTNEDANDKWLLAKDISGFVQVYVHVWYRTFFSLSLIHTFSKLI